MNNMFRKMIVYGLALILVFCAGCSGQNQSNLEGTSWFLTSLSESLLIPGTTGSIAFLDGRVSGTAGCNHFGGEYQIKGDSIEFDALSNTEMYCMEPEGVMEQELAFLNQLRGAVRWELANEELVIYDRDENALRFGTARPDSEVDPGGEQVDPTATVETPDPVETEEPVVVDPPWDYNTYRDPQTGITVFIPKGWIVTGIVEGDYAILQSYPEDKYVGGEAREEGDTKCDLSIKAEGTNSTEMIAEWKSAPTTNVIFEEPFQFNNGLSGMKLEIDSMGLSVVVAADLGGRAVALTCFGDFSVADELAATLDLP